MTIHFGPAGLGPVKDAVKTLEDYSKKGLEACEIAFTYGVYIKHDEDMKIIKEAAEKNKIKLSIHAPYWVNLNSSEPKKIQESKERILRCCEVGEKLGCYRVVFHPGYYGKMFPEETFDNIRNAVKDMQTIIKEKKWKIKIAVETMGKVNVFGSVEQIHKLIDETDLNRILSPEEMTKPQEADLKLIEKISRDVAQLVAHSLWERGVVSSSLAAPTSFLILLT